MEVPLFFILYRKKESQKTKRNLSIKDLNQKTLSEGEYP